MRCCCAPTSCKNCQRSSQTRTAAPSLTRPCCKVTYEKGTPQSLPSSTSFDSGWKKALGDARFVLAALSFVFYEAEAPTLEPLFLRTDSEAQRSVPPPLFLIHCAFLI